MDELIDKFIEKCLKYPEMDICEVYNRFQHLLNQEDRKVMADNFALFLCCGEVERSKSKENLVNN